MPDILDKIIDMDDATVQQVNDALAADPEFNEALHNSLDPIATYMDYAEEYLAGQAYEKDGAELLREATEYMKDKRDIVYGGGKHYVPWRNKFYDSSVNKKGLMRTVNYIAEMQKVLEQQAEELTKQAKRSDDDIFEEKNKKIKELEDKLSKAARYEWRSMDMNKADEIMNWYYTHILEEGGNIKGHKLHFTMFYGPLGCARECKCDCGAEYSFGDEKNW